MNGARCIRPISPIICAPNLGNRGGVGGDGSANLYCIMRYNQLYPGHDKNHRHDRFAQA
jgi:hypothetical protein